MKKILFLFLLITNTCYATQITTPYIYSTNDTVTNVKLNSNQNAITNVINGGLDNTNANTTTGYHFYQTVGALPSAGNQGSVYYLTSDNSLNFDTGSTFNKSVTSNSPSNGDTLYYNTGWNDLTIGANNTLMSSNGSVPSWGKTIGTSANNIVQLDSSSRLPAVDGSQLTNSFAQIFDYGVSATASTPRVLSTIKITYGNISVANKSSTNITTLPYTSSTSYKCTCNQVAGTLSLMNGPCAVAYVSGNTVSIENASDSTFTESWQCIGI